MSTTPTEAPATTLDRGLILKEEFVYARETAIQANADRTQIVNLYLLVFGGVGSVLLGLPALARGEGIAVPRGATAAGLSLLFLFGLFTVLKLIRLRQAWHDSVLAMNQVKDFYLRQFPDLEPAFRWRTHTIPTPGKTGTVSFDLTVLVALLDSVAAGAAVVLLTQSLFAAVLVAAALVAGQVGLYGRLLRP